MENKEFNISGIGQNVKTEAGSERQSDEGRGQPSLISPYLIRRLSKHMQKATIKYKKGNWAKGQKFSRIIDGIERHLIDYKLGEKKEDNLSAVVFGVMCLIHFEEVGREEELNDLCELWGINKPNHLKGE